MRIDEKTIDDVRKASSITQVIGHYIPLVKKGKRYTALCPFHDDHDPSLSISEDKQMFKCFVCGVGGNAFKFVMDYKKISFPESVKEVAAISGVDLKIDVTPTKKYNSKYQNYYDAFDKTINYANYLLTSTELGKEALSYLENRGITKDIIENYRIGYNPSGNKMYEYLKSENISDEILSEINVCRLTDSGMKDVFSDRILFPIFDSYGNPVAFTARDFKGTSDSKYINTSETKIYTKGNIIFNYHRARSECKRLNSVIVVEGVMDVIAFERAGITNVVATLGTACSKEQLKLLESLNSTIIFAYDGDNPGRSANIKNGQAAFEKGLNVFVMNNDTSLDPDEIINKFGNNKLRDLLSNRYSYVQYAIDYYKNSLNLKNYSDKKELHTKILHLLSYLKDEDEKESYANQLYDLTKISIKNIKDTSPTVIQYYDENTIRTNGILMAQFNILAMMANSIKACEIYKDRIGTLLDETCTNLAFDIILDYKEHGDCNLSRICDSTDNQNVANLIATIANTNNVLNEYNETIFNDTIDRVKKEIKSLEIKQLKESASEAQANGDSETSNELFIRYQEELKMFDKTYKEDK